MVVQAAILPFRRAYRPALRCGCYAAAIPEKGRMRWLRFPNWRGGSALFSTEDGREIIERGWIIIDGVKGFTRPAELGCPHWVEITWLEGQRWTKEHP